MGCERVDDQQVQAAIIRLSEEVASLKSELKSTWKRIDEQQKLSEAVHTLALSVRDLTNAQRNNTEAITALRRDVDELQQKPAKRWDSVVGVVITVITTAFVTYMVTKAGLK